MSINLKFKSHGESVVEVMIATTILVSILTAAFTLLIRGASSNINVANRVIAINIAREGIEAVRNIRDTNWLKYSGDRRTKWLCLDTPTIDCATTIDSQLSPLNYYSIDFNNTNKRYYLNIYPLTTEELDISPDSPSVGYENFQLFLDDSSGRYTHDDGEGVNIATGFYRQIKLYYPNPSDVCPSETYNHCKEKKLIVSVVVQWLEDNMVRSLSLETHLFDFYERNSY